MAAGDVLIIASNSGSNAVTTEMARQARDRGLRTIAITSLRARDVGRGPRERDGQRLHELVDVAIDNGGAVGDAAIAIEGLPTRVGADLDRRRAPPSRTRSWRRSWSGSSRRGIVPEVFTSSNVAGGDAVNERLLRAEPRR